jgi:hypothetical protein
MPTVHASRAPAAPPNASVNQSAALLSLSVRRACGATVFGKRSVKICWPHPPVSQESPRSQPHQHRYAIPWQVSQPSLVVAVRTTGRLVTTGAGRLAANRTNDQDNGIQLELQTMQLKFSSIGQQRALIPPIDRRSSEQCSVPKLSVRREYQQKCGRTQSFWT